MPKLTLNDLTNLQNETAAVAAINANNALVEGAFENTLSRDGSIPNEMFADLDMNSQRILNLPEAISSDEPIRKGDFDDALLSIVIGDLALPLSTTNGGLGINAGTSTGVPIFTSGTAIFQSTTGTGAVVRATDATIARVGIGSAPVVSGTVLESYGNALVVGNGTQLTRPYPSFANGGEGIPLSYGSVHIEASVSPPNIAGNALVVEAIMNGAGITSGGAAIFSAVNRTTDSVWDGYCTIHVLNTPIDQIKPAGSAVWALMRGGKGFLGTALDGIRSSNEMSYEPIVTFNIAADTVLLTAHNMIANLPVVFTSTGTLPTGIVSGTKYYVKTLTSVDAFTISATPGGAVIDLTGSPTGTCTMHVFCNPARGVIIFNSTPYNAFFTGLQVPSAQTYGVQVGDPVFSTLHIIPTHPYSYFNGDATPKELFFVNNDGTINLKMASNVNTRFLNMVASNDADTAIMAIAFQNASGVDRMIQWTDATTASYRFKSAGTLSFHTNNVVVSAAGAAISIDLSQVVTFNAYGAGTIISSSGGVLTSNPSTGTGNSVRATSPTITTPVISSITNTGTLTLPTSTDTLVGKATTDTFTNKTIDGAATGNVITHAGKSTLVLNVNRSTTQTPTAGVWTKVQLATEVTDPNNWFDNATNYRFQPNVACVCLVTGSLGMSVGTASYGGVSIYKNGAEYNKYILTASANDGWQLTVPAIVAFNGSSDYIELFGFSSGGAPSFTAGADISKLNIYQLY